MKVYFSVIQRDHRTLVKIISEAGKCVGSVGHGLSANMSKGLAIGYSIDSEFRKKGLMTKAVKLFLEHSNHNLFQAIVRPENRASQRVLFKAGFKLINYDEIRKNKHAIWVFEYSKTKIPKVA